MKKKKTMKSLLVGALSFMIAAPYNVMATEKQQPVSQLEQIKQIQSLTLEQLKELGNPDEVYVEETINTNTTNLVQVIVELKESIQHRAKSSAILEQQSTFIQTVTQKGLDINVGHTYQQVFNGMAVTIPGDQVHQLAEYPEVKAIYEDGVVTATPIFAEDISDGVPIIGAWEMNNLGFKGEGMKVGVLDTGIDYHHPDLKDNYKGGYDFVDKDHDPYETLPDGVGGETTHGTHVSGTIVGHNMSGEGVRGVAPEADLYVYRVLGPGGSGSDSDVIAGIEKSVEDNMDVINLSLGNGQEHNPYSPSAIAANNATLAGVTVVLSNGNNGSRGRYSVGSPASSDMAISVGASTLANTRYTGEVSISYRDPSGWQTSSEDAVESSNIITSQFPIKVMAWDQKDGPDGFAKVLKNVPLLYVGEGQESDYKGNVKGKAVLITRGDVSFIEKIMTAKKAGALAAFIFDKDSKYKGPINFYLGAGEYIPTYSLSEEAGMELLKTVQAYPDDELSLDFGSFRSTYSSGDEISSFSSRGPSMNLNIKPDVVAPGANIRSTIAAFGGDYKDAYQSMDGTSMAAPHVAGLSVLLKQKNPNYTPFDVKAAIMNTAKVLETPKYTVFDQGAGRVQGMNALTTDALAMVQEQSNADVDRDGRLKPTSHFTGSLLFGKIQSTSETISKTKSVILKDVAGKEQTYSVRYQITNLEHNGVTLTVPELVKVEANSEATFDVSINVPALTPSGEYQGYVYLTNLATGAKLHLPFVSFVGDVDMADGFTRVDLNYTHFSPNGDGNRDSISVKFGLNNKAEVVIGQLYHAKTGTYLGAAFGYVADGDHPALEAGEHIMEWDGTYQPWWSPERMEAPEGVYQLALVGFSEIPDSPLAPPFVSWVESKLFLQKEKPTVVIKESDYVAESDVYRIKGHLQDLYSSEGRGDLVKLQYNVRFIVDDRTGGDWVGTNDAGFFYANPDGSFEWDIKVDPGYNRISIEATTPAFNYSERPHMPSYLQLHVGEPTQYIVSPEHDIKLGEEFEVTVDARYVKKFIGGEIGFMYDENVMEYLGAEATEELKAYGEVTLIEKDLGNEDGEIPVPRIWFPDPGPWPPGPGDEEENPIMHSYKVAVALKGKTEGITGDISYVRLKFKATNNIKKVNLQHPIIIIDSNIVRLDAAGKEKLIAAFAIAGDVILHAPNQKIVGHVNSFFPEVFGEGTDFSKIGAKVYASWAGYLFPDTNNYLGGVTKEGTINADGSFEIPGLPSDQTFTVRLFVPGHLPGIMTNLQLIKAELGFYKPSDVSVQWDLTMLAGNVNNDNVINLLDLAIVSRYFGITNAKPEQGDINQDGQVDILDLSYVTANYDKWNENILSGGVTIPIPQRPIK